MANFPLAAGVNFVVFTGTTDLPLNSLPAAVTLVQAANANRTGYVSGRRGNSLGLTALKAVAGTTYNYYILTCAQAATLDATLFGVPPTELNLTFAAGQTATIGVPIRKADQVGSYAVTLSAGLTGISYSKTQGGAAVDVSTPLSLNDTLWITATAADSQGYLLLTRQ